MDPIIESYYNDVKEAPYDFLNPQTIGSGGGLTPRTGGGGDQVVQIGSGDDSINMDLTGMWVGSRKYFNAPFRLDMKGSLIARILSKDGTLIMDENGIASVINFPNANHTKKCRPNYYWNRLAKCFSLVSQHQ